ncbi:MAG: bifunctional nuclease domain-containing protein [Thermodesulfobacteriota bacterium]
MTPKETSVLIFAAAAFCLALVIFQSATAFSAESGRPPVNRKDLMEVRVYNLVEVTNESSVVLLSDPDAKTAMPVWISPFEANAIYLELGGIKPLRPQTHDLLKKMIETLGGILRHVVITHESENVYYAKIVMDKDGGALEVDARPSDSIVLALKFNAPILVAKNLFAARSVPIVEDTESIQRYGLTLQELSPALAQYLSLGSVTGVLVAEVREGSQAEKDGLKAKDVIVELENESVKGIDAVKALLSRGPGEIRAKIYRGTEFIILSLHVKGN